MARQRVFDADSIFSFIPPAESEWERLLTEHPEWKSTGTLGSPETHRAERKRVMANSWRNTYSNFLKAADLPREGKRVRIVSIDEQVLREKEPPKLVAELKGLKPWVLNVTNCELLEEITGSENPADWVDETVELFNDRTVRGPNGEKGGIRVRVADGKKSRQSRKEKEDEAPFVDDEDLDDLDDD
jgi:hypothetical protein